MARRPDLAEFDKPLSRDQLAQLTRRLAVLSPYDVAKAFRNAHVRCAMNGDLLPAAAAVQELVTAWRLMRRRKSRGIGGACTLEGLMRA
jgi:hypothetical protein